MQVNKISGQNTLSIINGQHPTLPLIGLNSGGTVNQKAEAAADQFGYYGLISPDPHLFSLALDRCISQLKDELANGHMLGELLSDSHEPIHLRARASLMLYLLRLNSKIVGISAFSAVGQLSDLLSAWFEHHIALLSLGLVPSGPLAGCILLPCARKRGATREDPPRDTANHLLACVDGWNKASDPWPGDPIREAVLALIAGRSPLPHRLPSVRPKSTHLGHNALTLSPDSQDTAAVPITSMILAKGGFGPNVLRGILPCVITPGAANFTITFYPDGHWARFGDSQAARAINSLSLLDSVSSLWVQYSSGKFSFLDPSDTPHPFGGEKVIGEVSWNERGEPRQ